MNHILVSKENFDFFSHILPEEYYTEGTRITLGAYDNDGVVHGVISYVSLGYECIIDWIFVEAASRRKGVGTGLIREVLSAIKNTGICPVSARFEVRKNSGIYNFFLSFDEFDTEYLFDRYYISSRELMNSKALQKEVKSKLSRHEFFDQSDRARRAVMAKLEDLENGFDIEDPEKWEESCVPELCLFSGAEDDPQTVIFIQKRDDGDLELSYLFSTNPMEMISLMGDLRKMIVSKYPNSDLVFDAVNPTSDGIARKLFPGAIPINIYSASYPV